MHPRHGFKVMEERNPIAIWATVAASFGFIRRHPRALVRVIWLPVLAVFLLNLAFGVHVPARGPVDLAQAGPLMMKIGLNLLLQTVVAAAVLVAWHRVVLFGEAGRGVIGLTFGRRELRYLAVWLGLGLVFLILYALAFALILAALFLLMLVASLIATLPGLGNSEQFFNLQVLALVLAVPLATYFAVRLSLILPALATDRRRSFGQSWSMSGGNGWRLTVASMLAMLPLELASIGLGLGVKAAHGTLAYHPLALLAAVMLLLMMVAAGTVLSLFSLALDPQPDDRTAGARREFGAVGGLIAASS